MLTDKKMLHLMGHFLFKAAPSTNGPFNFILVFHL